ncbi:hypothetical protein DRO97_03390 [Archaeoglobales archaeon]|nr:MAG: hypothetical protein DRO97_03390 [Archaeoglobales archaeon]
MMDRIIIEILRVLAESDKPLSSQDISNKLREIGICIDPRTVRYHLNKMDAAGLTTKPKKYKRMITKKGKEQLRRSLVYERLGEFSERVEYNVYTSTFNLREMKGTIPTNIAIIDKKHADYALNILKDVSGSKLFPSDLIAIADEGENLGEFIISDGKFGIGVISNTIFDVILRNVGVVLHPESSTLLHFEKGEARGFSEIISYSGLTLSPGWLFIKSGLTSVYDVATKGVGEIITAIRSFSIYTIDLVKDELGVAQSNGIGGILTISYPLDDIFSLPTLGRKAALILMAGLNYLAPLQEKKLDPEIRINEVFIEYGDFSPIEKFV